MFYLFLIFHIIVYIEVFFLFQKKLRKTGSLLAISNTFFLVLNLLALIKPFSLDYSSIIFLREEMKNHVFFNILWILLNFLDFVYVYFVSKRLKKMGFMSTILTIMMSVIGCVLISCLMPNQATLIFLLFLIYWIYFGIQKFYHTKKNYYLVSIVILLMILCYSYLSDMGSVRFSIALAGYPSIAYDTGFEELKYFEEKNMKKFSPIEEIPLKEGRIGLIEVKKVLFLRFSNIYKA